ncbi:hypothetical protein VE02_06923 [Pseudogymnoascus sp. 03VT05]|nr:hypothetical protein VE02_06923 [Pseudogymnoascus sp. 03VT05]
MADPLTAVGIVANIVQLVDFSAKVLARLDDFQSNLGEIPKAFRHIKAELPVLQDALKQTKDKIDHGTIEDSTKTALLPAVQGCKVQIEALDGLLAETLPVAGDSRFKKTTKALWSITHDGKVESITKTLRGYIATLTFYHAAASSTLQPMKDTKLVEIRRWLSAPDPSINYQKAIKLRQPNTGLWLLEGEVYSKWKRNASSFTWLYGIPGCGKTILSSTVTQDILHYCANDPGKVVAYFYFDFTDADKQKAELMVRSLISQLSEQCIKMPSTLDALYSSSDKGNRQPSLDALMNVLQQILEEFPQSYLILDALDEGADRLELLSILEQMARWQLEELRVLVTSRQLGDIKSSLEDIVNGEYIICLQSQVVDKDIQSYVRQRLSDDKRLKKWQKDDEIRREIEATLMEGTRGMFRWAVCQMDTLGKCRTRSALQNALKALPTTLDETYERILCTISEADSEHAMRILKWLAFSSRPLSVEELAEVVAINVEREAAFDRDEALEDPMDVLDICLGLVSVTEEPSLSEPSRSLSTASRTATLAHYSVQEYLISPGICQGRAARYSMQPAVCHGYIAKGSISYLLQFENGLFNRFESARSLQQVYALAQYSAEHWIIHTRKAEEDDNRLSYLATKLLSTGDGAYLNWLRLYDPDRLSALNELRPIPIDPQLFDDDELQLKRQLLGESDDEVEFQLSRQEPRSPSIPNESDDVASESGDSEALLIVGASSAQLAFYIETGGEIKWGAVSNVPRGSAGYKLLLTGSILALLVALFIIVVARVVSGVLYNRTEVLVSKLAKTFSTPRFQSSTKSNEQLYNEYSPEGSVFDSILSEADIDYVSSDPENFKLATSSCESHRAQNRSLWLRRGLFLAPVVTVSILLAVRPQPFPYTHMSGSLPFTLLDIWSRPDPRNLCQAGSSREFTPFPLPDLISPKLWELPNGKFVGWMPRVNVPIQQTDIQLPSWLPQERIPGFDRWYHHGRSADKHHHKHHHGHVSYDPSSDPLRISNLDGDILASITEAMKENKVSIKHVVILSLESTRKDVFPLKKGSHLHDAIMKTHGSKESAAEANSQLAKLTVNAEILTGEDSGFDVKNRNPPGNQTWRALSKEKGGLNVIGAFTGSSSTFKSMLGSHCGVQPLPVDFTVEAGAPIYQPCLPSILGLFNRNKQNGQSSKHNEDVRWRPWNSVFVQSITDQYDGQDELNERIGFSQSITKQTLVNPLSNHYPPTELDSNYFGLPESQVKPYLLDVFRSAKERNERLFLSHFTSSTHHPWNTPEAAGENIDFLQKRKWRSERPLNRYLNTVKYGDRWIGEIMDMLDEFSMADETLVVMVGDHGYAFEEESNTHSTFENGHISNIRVPLLFYHPSLSIIPTILDLLVATSSLSTQDLDIASNLIHQYEGQSLIRPFVAKKHGRQQWNIAVLNAGGAVLSVSSAAVPVLPICKSGVYRFTDTEQDPNETSAIEENSISALAKRLRENFGDETSKWVIEAEEVGKWWVLEQRLRWGYDGASLQGDRNPDDMYGMGKTKGRHWWEMLP